MFPPDSELYYSQDKPRIRKARASTTEGRFYERIKIWKDYSVGYPVTHLRPPFRFPRLRHAFHWFLHNVPVHFLLGICPCRLTFKIHDWSSERLNATHMYKLINDIK